MMFYNNIFWLSKIGDTLGFLKAFIWLICIIKCHLNQMKSFQYKGYSKRANWSEHCKRWDAEAACSEQRLWSATALNFKLRFAQALRPWENHLMSSSAACYLQTGHSPAPDTEYSLIITRYWNYKPCIFLSQYAVSGQAPTKECAAGRMRGQQPPKDACTSPQKLRIHYPTRQQGVCICKLRSQDGQSSSELTRWPKDIPKVLLSERRRPEI